jgi:hypothetical protein
MASPPVSDRDTSALAWRLHWGVTSWVRRPKHACVIMLSPYLQIAAVLHDETEMLMTITYLDGTVLKAIVLSHDEHVVRRCCRLQ